jgi:hypothetical protein
LNDAMAFKVSAYSRSKIAPNHARYPNTLFALGGAMYPRSAFGAGIGFSPTISRIISGNVPTPTTSSPRASEATRLRVMGENLGETERAVCVSARGSGTGQAGGGGTRSTRSADRSHGFDRRVRPDDAHLECGRRAAGLSRVERANVLRCRTH